MKLSVSRDSLSAALQLVGRAVSTRGTLPSLGGILVIAADGAVTLRATDMELALTRDASPTRRPSRTAPCCCPAACSPTSSAACRRARSASSCAASSATSRSRPAARAFTSAPCPPTTSRACPSSRARPCKLPGGPLAETIDLVARAASRDEVRPILTGVLVQAEGTTLTMVATDSYRLSVKHTELEAPVSAPLEANVPARALRELARIVSGEGAEEVEISLAAQPGGLPRRRRRALLAADRGPVPELAPADPGGVRARGPPAARGVPRDHPADQPARAAQRAAAARVRRGRADRRRRDARHRRRQRGDAGAVLGRAARDRLQPAVPGRGRRERRHRAGRDPAQLAAAARACCARSTATTSRTSSCRSA